MKSKQGRSLSGLDPSEPTGVFSEQAVYAARNKRASMAKEVRPLAYFLFIIQIAGVVFDVASPARRRNEPASGRPVAEFLAFEGEPVLGPRVVHAAHPTDRIQEAGIHFAAVNHPLVDVEQHDFAYH